MNSVVPLKVIPQSATPGRPRWRRIADALLLSIPFVSAFTIPLVSRVVLYASVGELGLFKSIQFTLVESVGMLDTNGLGGALVFLMHYGTAFGAVTVAAWFLYRRMYFRRWACFVLAATAIPFGFALAKHMTRLWAHAEWIASRGKNTLGQHWFAFTIDYPLYAVFIGFALGWVLSALPIFRPGALYWIERGLCPKCRYRLGDGIDPGCPECGWNRRDSETKRP